MRRRAFLILSASTVAGTLNACADLDAPAPTPPPFSSFDPRPSTKPTVVNGVRFGPTGRHFPALAPDPAHLKGATVVTAAPNGTAIRAVLAGLSAAQIAAGAIVAVTPGTITDQLGGLKGFRNPGTRPITICPQGGFDTVTVGPNGLLLTDVDGVNLCGFVAPKVELKGCTRSSVSRTIVTKNYASVSTTGTFASSNCGLYEVVMLDSVVKSSDSSQTQNLKSGLTLSNVTIAGCVIAPSFYLDRAYNGPGEPRRPHTDSLQLTCSSKAPLSGVLVRDTQIWASNNSAMILAGPTANVTIDNALIVGGHTAQARYPFKPGGAGYKGAQQGPGTLSAIQGIGDGTSVAINSVLIGSANPRWRRVTGSMASLARVAQSSPGFTNAPSLVQTTDSGFTHMGAPRFTHKRLATLWKYAPLT